MNRLAQGMDGQMDKWKEFRRSVKMIVSMTEDNEMCGLMKQMMEGMDETDGVTDG